MNGAQYRKAYELLELLGVFRIKESVKIENPGFMPLCIEKIYQQTDRQGVIYQVYSLTHYYKQNGDLCPDPDMEIRVNDKYKIAEALTYQDSFGYREVYPEPGQVNFNAKKELNAFLVQWLTNLLEQGFRIKEEEKQTVLMV